MDVHYVVQASWLTRNMEMIHVPRDPSDYEAVGNMVRSFCTERLYELERSLRPLVDGSFGEIIPGHVTGYLGVLKELARLYQAHKPPLDLQNLVPVDKVEQVLARMKEQHELALQEAVAAAEARVRMELERGDRLSIQSAKATVMTRLMDLEKRA